MQDKITLVEDAFVAGFPRQLPLVNGFPREATLLTAADAPFFPGLQSLLLSVRQLHPTLPIQVYDLGLTMPQREWTRRCATLLDPGAGMMDRSVRGWQTWNKPYYLINCPAQLVLWIDADCLVANDLRPLLQRLAERPLIVRHWDQKDLCRNHRQLYQRFPVKTRLPRRQLMNAGVCGWDKRRPLDLTILRAWAMLIGFAAVDSGLRDCIRWYDEGALQWTLEWLGLTELTSQETNWDVYDETHHVPPAEFYARIDRRNIINHYAIQEKYWARW